MRDVRQLTMTLAALAVTALGATPASAAPPPARTEPAPETEVTVLAKGFYAISCDVRGHGTTRDDAIRECNRGVRRSRYATMKRCDCRRHADVFEVGEDRDPDKWLASWAFVGKTPAEATALCERELSRYDKERLPECATALQPMWGPFERRIKQREYDDPARYRWLSRDSGWLDEIGAGPCFTGDTLVATPGGPRPIAELTPGDRVLTRAALDESATSAAAPASATVGIVTAVKRRMAEEILVMRLTDGRTLRVTANHPLYSVTRGFTPAGELRVGEALATRDAEGVPHEIVVVAVTTERGWVDVYDITVEPTHTYFAADVWVHNY